MKHRFNPHTLTGCDFRRLLPISLRHDFNPHTPCGVRSPHSTEQRPTDRGFNPHTPHGVRWKTCRKNVDFCRFNPHTPHGMRSLQHPSMAIVSVFQSPHPSRGAIGSNYITATEIREVSIPTPLTGCDELCGFEWRDINWFQSPHPSRGAMCPTRLQHHQSSFNPHTPHGVRCPNPFRWIFGDRRFNPHTPHGVRYGGTRAWRDLREFQSPHPSRGAIAKHHNIVKYNLCILLKLQAFCTDTEHFYCPILNIFKYVIIYTLFFMVRTSGNIMYAYGSHLTQ